LIVAAVLWTWLHRFARFATMVCVLALTGFATYALIRRAAVAAARHGTIGESNRLIGIVWQHVPIAHYGRCSRRPDVREQRRGDAVAARRLRAVDRALPVAARPALVAGVPRALPTRDGVRARVPGEHYVVDCIAGSTPWRRSRR
jgi:hypothetical protein